MEVTTTCGHCSKSFANISELQNHIGVHRTGTTNIELYEILRKWGLEANYILEEDYEAPLPIDLLAKRILALIHRHQNQLLDKLLEEKKTYITELAWKHAASEDAVPVEAINKLRRHR